MNRRSVFTLESEAGGLKKDLGLLQNLETFGHVLGQVDQVIGIPEPGRIRAILLESKIVYVMQANIQTGGRAGISLLNSLLPVLMGSTAQDDLDEVQEFRILEMATVIVQEVLQVHMIKGVLDVINGQYPAVGFDHQSFQLKEHVPRTAMGSKSHRTGKEELLPERCECLVHCA